MKRFDMLAHDLSLYHRTPRAFAFKAKNPSGVRAWQARFRPALARALGLDVMRRELGKWKPRVEKVLTEDMGSYSRTKFRIWTEPDVPVPFWMLKPKGATGRLPLVMTPHGHLPTHVYLGIARNAYERHLIRDSQDNVAVQAVGEGYLVLHPTVRGFGETREAGDLKKDNLCSCYQMEMRGIMLGRSAIGQRVWDIQRMLDWALRRGDVDARRVAITGNSGGGTVSLFAAACDTRITVAVPSCYFCTFEGSIGSLEHCACNYIPGIMRMGEMHDVAGLVAPRPFRAVAGRKDDIYPLGETRKAFRMLKKAYRVAGVPGRCELYVGAGGHRYYRDGVWPFIGKWFKGRSGW